MVQAIDLVRERLQKNEEPEAICKAMCDHCMAPDTQVWADTHPSLQTV